MTKTYGPPFVITKSWIILNFELDNEKGRWQFSYTTFMISNKFPGAKKKYESIESIKTTKDSQVQVLRVVCFTCTFKHIMQHAENAHNPLLIS